jgi:TonB-dependent starch-binding outer membrane protein SusC
MKHCAALVAVFALVPVQITHAQDFGTIAGLVTAGESGAPLPGTNVTVVGTEHSVTTGADGRYVLTGVSPGTHRVRARLIGYAWGEVGVTVVAGQAVTADIQLVLQAIQLQEVVTVGYGAQSRRDLTDAVSSATTEALERAPVRSVDQMLQGTAPGVQVTTASSEPGGALSIRIRGTSSITGNAEPLYVIDGFPIENDIEGAAVGNGGRTRTTPPNPLATLNPSDIESISILKDASATAIYGARGANGVVIITTKQGRGSKPQVSLDYSTGVQGVSRRYGLLNAREYMDYANEFARNSSSPYNPFPDSVYNAILASGIDTDWQDQIFRAASIRNMQVGVRGAAGAASTTRYALSGGYFDQDGIVVGSGFTRYSARLNLGQSLGTRIELGGSLAASQAWLRPGRGAAQGALEHAPRGRLRPGEPGRGQ